MMVLLGGGRRMVVMVVPVGEVGAGVGILGGGVGILGGGVHSSMVVVVQRRLSLQAASPPYTFTYKAEYQRKYSKSEIGWVEC